MAFEGKDGNGFKLFSYPSLWWNQAAVDRIDRGLQRAKSARGERYGK